MHKKKLKSKSVVELATSLSLLSAQNVELRKQNLLSSLCCSVLRHLSRVMMERDKRERLVASPVCGLSKKDVT